MLIRAAVLIAVAGTLAITSTSTWAQSGVSITPGQVTDTLKAPPELPAPPVTPQIESQIPEPSPATAPESTEKTIVVTAFQFTGNELYSSLELEALLFDFLKKPLSLLDIYAAADVVTAHYTRNGYTLASVNVPPQKVSSGTILLEVTEGKIGKILLEQPSRRKEENIAGYLGVTKGEIYRTAAVEDGMRRLNELPGLVARAVVRPGEEYGTTDIAVKTQDTLVTGIAFADNYGRENIGETRTAASINLNNPFGNDDQFQFLGLVSSAASLKYGNLAYAVPLGFSGTRLNLSYGLADFETRDALVTGDSHNARIAVDVPLVRTPSDRLNFVAGVAHTRTTTEIVGAPETGDQITVLEIGTNYNLLHANAGVTQLNATLTTNFQGTDREEFNEERGFGQQTVSGSKRVRGKQLARLEVDAIHILPLPQRFTLATHLNGVYSPDPLADPSGYSIGGPQSVRGFPASEVRGDRGWFGQLTLSQNYFFGPVLFAPRVFVDGGHVSLVEQPDSGGGTPDNALSSYGLGFDVGWQMLNFKLDASKPIGRDRNDPEKTISDGRYSGHIYAALFASF